MSRAVDEWRGKTANTKVPPRVRARIFLREEGKCWSSGRKIGSSDVWELDHKVALINGGEHRESNLFPALKDKHREKTAEDVKLKSKTYRMAAKNNGSWPKSRAKIKSRGFQSSRPSAVERGE